MIAGLSIFADLNILPWPVSIIVVSEILTGVIVGLEFAIFSIISNS